VTQLTDTVPISATRLMDVAREVVLQLGEFQHHPALVVTTYTQLGDGPHIVIYLAADRASHADQASFLDLLAIALDTVVRVSPTWIGSAYSLGYRGTGVTVAGQGRIVEVSS